MSGKQEVTDIAMPHANDVLSGRGGMINKHPGNLKFIELVKSYKNAYVKSHKSRKSIYSKMIYKQVRDMDPPGRFLKQDPNTGLWNDIGKKKALAKTRQALREGAPKLLKELEDDGGSSSSDISSAAQDSSGSSSSGSHCVKQVTNTRSSSVGGQRKTLVETREALQENALKLSEELDDDGGTGDLSTSDLSSIAQDNGAGGPEHLEADITSLSNNVRSPSKKRLGFKCDASIDSSCSFDLMSLPMIPAPLKKRVKYNASLPNQVNIMTNEWHGPFNMHTTLQHSNSTTARWSQLQVQNAPTHLQSNVCNQVIQQAGDQANHQNAREFDCDYISFLNTLRNPSLSNNVTNISAPAHAILQTESNHDLQSQLHPPNAALQLQNTYTEEIQQDSDQNAARIDRNTTLTTDNPPSHSISNGRALAGLDTILAAIRNNAITSNTTAPTVSSSNFGRPVAGGIHSTYGSLTQNLDSQQAYPMIQTQPIVNLGSSSAMHSNAVAGLELVQFQMTLQQMQRQLGYNNAVLSTSTSNSNIEHSEFEGTRLTPNFNMYQQLQTPLPFQQSPSQIVGLPQLSLTTNSPLETTDRNDAVDNTSPTKCTK